MDHVTDNLGKEVHSGYDTAAVNVLICDILKQVLYESWRTDGEPASYDPDSVFSQKQLDLASLGAKPTEKFGAFKLIVNIVAGAPHDQNLMRAALSLGYYLVLNGNTAVQLKFHEYLKAEKTVGANFF